MTIYILATTQNGEIVEIPISGKISVGRNHVCKYCFAKDDLMSGQHGLFQLGKDGELLYTDTDSSNGSFLDDKKIKEAILKPGSVLKLGSTLFKIDENRIAEQEYENISGKRITTGLDEDKTVLIINSEILSRPVFEKRADEGRSTLAERWSNEDNFSRKDKASLKDGNETVLQVIPQQIKIKK